MKTPRFVTGISVILTTSAALFPTQADQTILVPIGTTNTTGIFTNGGNDTVIVESNAAVWVSATGVPAVAAVNPDGGTNLVVNYGLIHASGKIPESTNASLTVTALSTGAGSTTVTNMSSVEAIATIGDDPAAGTNFLTAHSTAIGIAAGGNDTIINNGSINAFATNELVRGSPLTVSLLGLDIGTNSTTAGANATGVAGGNGPISITSDNSVTANADARIFPFKLELTLEDAASADATMNAIAIATGIAGGTGTSSITNNGLITASAHADVGSTSIERTLSSAVSADTSLNANANAIGITGGSGSGTIHNANQVNSTALAEAQTVDVSLSLTSVGKADSMLAPVANASGIAGGASADQITNDGNITANATADASRVGVTATLYDFAPLVQELVDAAADNTTKANATAIGLDGGFGNDVLANWGSVSANATSKVVTVDVSLSSEGIPAVSQVTNVIFGHSLASLDRIAEASATGMTGGDGDDVILNAGSLTADSYAESSVTSVTVGFALPNPLWFLPGIPIATAGSSNRTVALGIAGGDGNDTIINTNSGGLTVKSTSDVTSAGVAAQLDVGIGEAPVNVSVPLANSRTESEAMAIGIDGGNGNDSVLNLGSINTTATADALSVVGSLNVAFSGKGVNISAPLADATTRVSSTATGISGGAGNDVIVNEAGAANNVTSVSRANSWLLSADIQGQVEGLDVGVPMASAGVVSEAIATGIDGGDGDDTVQNEGHLHTVAAGGASSKVASLKVTGVATGVSAGLTMTDAATTNQTTAMGIQGGAGNDTIINAAMGTNTVSANSDVQSLGIAVTVIGPTEGVAIALGKVDANTTANAEAIGIQGGDGTNFIHNAGLTEAHSAATNLNIAVGAGVTVTLDTGVGIAGAKVDAGSEAHVESSGIAVGDGGSMVINDGTVRATADTKAQTVSVAVTANVGIGAGFLDTDASTVANSISRGIQGGSGNDFITNSSTGDVEATASSSVTSAAAGINLSIAGIGLTDASAIATNRATGIDAGSGHDMVSNDGHVAATADADLKALAITFGGLIGGSWAAAETTADATTVGIDGGAGVNQLSNTGTLDVLANGHLTSTAISITGEGYSEADASSTARAESVGLAAGDDGNMIFNAGTVRANSATDAKSTSVTVTVGVGGINADASTVANSIATGIQTGAGNDVITNSSSGIILVNAASTNDAAAVGVRVLGPGGGVTDASATATNRATGIGAGGGQDVVRNAGNITVTANAAGDADAFTFAGVAGAGAAKAGTTAEAVAVGIDGGDGADQLSNTGALGVLATTELEAGSVAIAIAGFSSADAKANAEAVAVGIDGGDGADQLSNTGTLDVLATTELEAGSVAINVVGSSSTDAKATSHANAIGLQGGAEDDYVSNSGTVNVHTKSALDVTSKTFSLVGSSSAKITETTAEATATGLDGGDGDDVLLNDGILFITLADGQPMAEAVGRSTSWNLIGVASADVTLSANVIATGMAGGEGDDIIVNRGTNIVGGPLSGTAMAEVDASGSSWTFAGGASAGTVAAASTESTGLSGGDGNNWMENDGWVQVNATAHLKSDNSSYAAYGGSKTTARVVASSDAGGIECGDGDDSVVNAGFLTVNSSARSQTAGTAETGWLYGKGNSQSDALSTAAALGATLGEGLNQFSNTNQIAVLSVAYANAKANGDGAGVWNGDASSRTSSVVTNRAVGIAAGDGTNSISNSGIISVITRKADGDAAMAVATSNADGDGLDGDGWAKAVASVDASSTGVQVGNGLFDIWNSGSLTVIAEPTASASVSVDGDNTGNATGITESTAKGEAVGIRTGDGDGLISNSGNLIVTATASANDYASIAGGWLGKDISSRTVTAQARAVGITTGDGTHQITNCGTILVQAEASSNYGHPVLSATAIGIQTGEGEDTIVNCGILSAITLTGSAAGIGVAIDSGLGDDDVRLGEGSSTIGRVELGGGNDQLILAGTPDVSGALNGGSGTDTLVLDGVGSYDSSEAGALLSFERALKCGAGMFTLWRGLFTVERLEVTEGTLELHGDYTFQGYGGGEVPDGYFGTVVNGDGSCGQLLVLGQAYLDGDIVVNRGPGPFALGLTAYDVIIATNGAENSFISTNLPGAHPLLSFDFNQLSDRVQVKTLGISFTTMAHNEVELAVANYLDQILVPGDTNDLGSVLDTMQQMEESEFSPAFSSLSPDSYDAYTRAAHGTILQHSKNMQQRLTTLRWAADRRNDSETSQSSAPANMLLASSSDDLGEVLSRERQRAERDPNGVWADTFGQWSDQQGNDGHTGFEYDVWGMTVGYDRAINNRLTLGLSGAYATTSVDLDNDRGAGDIDNFSGSLYGSYDCDNLHFEGVFSYGNNRYESHRNLQIDGISRRARSSHDGQATGVFFSGGYPYQLKKWTLEPFASVQYTHLDEDSFSETGAGGVNLLVDGRQTDSLVSELGLRLGRVIKAKSFTFVPELNLAWNYDFGIDDRVLSASFAGSPGASFRIPGQDVEPSGVTAGAGLTFLFHNDITTSVRYKGEFRDDYSGHAVVGELRFSF